LSGGLARPCLLHPPNLKFKMPVTFTHDPEAKTIQAVATGILSCEEVLGYIQEKRETRVLGYAELFDVRGVTLDLSISDLHRIAAAARAAMGLISQGRTAVVTDSSFIRGLALTYAAMTANENPEFNVFHDLKEARAWTFSREK
jgi:hypothetical protein